MILLDTNILARILQPGVPHHQPSIDAVVLLHNQKQILAICPQNILELYAIATRTTNGLNMTPNEALTEITAFKSYFYFLPDVPLHHKWEELIAKYQIANRLVFDLRLVAAAMIGDCSAILTFNDEHFSRFSEIQAINPFDLLHIPRI